MPALRLRITSDGTPQGTTVMDAETGRTLSQVRAATWRCDAESPAVVTLELFNVEVDLVGEEQEN